MAAAAPVLRAFRASASVRSAAYQQARFASSKSASLKDAFGAQVPKLIEQNKKLKK
jgi:hypothetical protein